MSQSHRLRIGFQAALHDFGDTSRRRQYPWGTGAFEHTRRHDTKVIDLSDIWKRMKNLGGSVQEAV